MPPHKQRTERELILGLLSPPQLPMTLMDMERRLKVRGQERRAFLEVVLDLERAGELRKVRGGRWTTTGRGTNLVTGRLGVTSRGFGFVRPEAEGSMVHGDLYISQEHMGAALDGDLVRAEVLRFDERGAAGRIREVLEHSHTKMVGYYQSGRRGGSVRPRNTKIDRMITVPKPDDALGIKDLDWVWVEIDEFPAIPDPLRGRVVERLGKDEDKGIDVLLLLRDRGIVEEFPAHVLKEAQALTVDWPAEIKRRTDHRKRPTITIDPATAKDFDDALSIERLKNGWRLYVHIADVAHFVRPGSAIDNEARERSTSVYPVDRVVPMLPERLSANLCSLRPGEDRLTMTVEIVFDEDGHPISSKTYDSIIHSHYRFAYEQVQALFDGSDHELAARTSDMADDIAEMRALARKLRKNRFERGALDLDIPQLSVIFDAKGAVSDLKFYPRFEAHQLIEECMICANEAVAREVTAKKAAMAYRIHEPADEDQLARLVPILRVFGIRIPAKRGDITPKALQAALRQAERLKGGHIVRRLILRALKRAIYSTENPGHFGLASDSYCHFTSPIRRYPDVVVHRQAKALASKSELPYGKAGDEDSDLPSLLEHCCYKEREAQEAEWESTRIKALEFMQKYEGEEFDGIIGGIQPFGIFVELDQYPVEGLVSVRDLQGDHFDPDELGVKMVGRRSGREYRLGQPVRVTITRVVPLEQQMDLRLVEEDGSFRPRKRRK